MPGPGVFAVLPSVSFEVPERGAWSPRHDADLAEVAARTLVSPPLQRALEELHALRDDRERLLAHGTLLQTRRLATSGVTREQYLQAFPAAPAEHLAEFAERPASAGLANDGDLEIAAAMALAYHAATEAPAAYYLHRSIPTPGAEAAAQVLQTALDGGYLREEELLAAARALAYGQTPLVPPACQLPRRSPALDVLAARLCDALRRTGRAVGAAFAFVRTVDIDLPLVLAAEDEEFQIYLLLAGPRLLLALLFRGELPHWVAQISSMTASPEGVRYPEETMILYPLTAGDPLAPARAVARLRSYLARTLEEHLGNHPADAELFPELDDDHLDKMFG